VDQLDVVSLAGIQKPNRIDVDEVQVAQIQNHRPTIAFDLRPQPAELFTSKCAAQRIRVACFSEIRTIFSVMSGPNHVTQEATQKRCQKK
jgi:hypothetical protein